MSVQNKRKVHSPELKSKVGLEAVNGVKTINEIGQEYGVHPIQVGMTNVNYFYQSRCLMEECSREFKVDLNLLDQLQSASFFHLNMHKATSWCCL